MAYVSMMYWAELLACSPTQAPGRTPAACSCWPVASIAASSSPDDRPAADRGPRIAACRGWRAAVSRNRWYRLLLMLVRNMPAQRLRGECGGRVSRCLAHRPASADDPRRGMRPAVGRKALAAHPQIIHARYLEGSQGNPVRYSLGQIFDARAALGVPVFDRPRAAACSVRESSPLANVFGREGIAPANTPAIAYAKAARLAHRGPRKIGETLEELHDRGLRFGGAAGNHRGFI